MDRRLVKQPNASIYPHIPSDKLRALIFAAGNVHLQYIYSINGLMERVSDLNERTGGQVITATYS